MKKLVRAKSLSEQVCDAICAEIESGGIKVGQMLSESMIAERLGVSRTPVREAFSHLEQKGLVLTQPKKGTFVFDPDKQAVSDLFQVSGGLELQGLRLSLRTNREALRDNVSELFVEMDRAFSTDRANEYQLMNAAMHGAFVYFSGNLLLIEIYETLEIKLKALSHTSVNREMFNNKIHDEHRKIVDAVVGDSPEQAIPLLETHLDC